MSDSVFVVRGKREKKESRWTQVSIRLTNEERALWVEAAAKVDLSPPNFFRVAMTRAIEAVAADPENFYHHPPDVEVAPYP